MMNLQMFVTERKQRREDCLLEDWQVHRNTLSGPEERNSSSNARGILHPGGPDTASGLLRDICLVHQVTGH